jgi:hypothetical protein
MDELIFVSGGGGSYVVTAPRIIPLMNGDSGRGRGGVYSDNDISYVDPNASEGCVSRAQVAAIGAYFGEIGDWNGNGTAFDEGALSVAAVGVIGAGIVLAAEISVAGAVTASTARGAFSTLAATAGLSNWALQYQDGFFDALAVAANKYKSEVTGCFG